MTPTTHSLRFATTAIAAVLASTSTLALAQDPAAPFPAAPEPVIVIPDIPIPVASPEPTIVLPTELPETPADVPEANLPPADAEIAPPPPTARVQPRAVAPSPVERAAPAPEPVPEIDTTAPVMAEPADVPPPAVLEQPATPVVASEPAPVSSDNTTGILALILGGLAVLALAIWGFVAIGRRKPIERRAAAVLAERPMPAAREPIVVDRAPVTPETIEAEPQLLAERAPEQRVQPIFASRPVAASGGLPHTGASVALPRELPASYENREALFRRMVDARPDRANPFTDRKARMKRARLILQSLGRDFGDTEPWIDLSQYPNNWPELAGRRHAAA